jgi:hypothetical protein
MGLAHAVEMNVEGEALVWLGLVKQPLQQDSVGTHNDVPFARDGFGNQLGQLRIDGRLATADRDYWRARFLYGLQTLLQTEPVFQVTSMTLGRAAYTRQVAGIQWLEHQHDRVAFAPLQLILELPLHHVGSNVQRIPH